MFDQFAEVVRVRGLVKVCMNDLMLDAVLGDPGELEVDDLRFSKDGRSSIGSASRNDSVSSASSIECCSCCFVSSCGARCT